MDIENDTVENTGFSVSDIRDKHIQQLKNHVNHVVSKEINSSVDSIHVMGSLARGDGTRGKSDIDIRVVTTGLVKEETIEALHDTFKHDMETTTPPSCTYIDIHITPLHPDGTEQSQQI